MEIQILGAHMTEGEDIQPPSFLIDGILALDAGSLSKLSLSAQQRLKAVLLTHYHYDHIKDIPLLGMNFSHWGTLSIYSIPEVFDALTAHLLNWKIYPNFLEWPSKEKSALKFFPLEPYKAEAIEGYHILAIPVAHTVPTVGFQVTSPEGKRVFYTSDTGPGLSACWEWVSPDLLITEVSLPKGWEGKAREAGHLTPELLKLELLQFRQIKGYLPRTILIHLNPFLEDKIKEGVKEITQELGTDIEIGREGMKIYL